MLLSTCQKRLLINGAKNRPRLSKALLIKYYIKKMGFVKSPKAPDWKAPDLGPGLDPRPPDGPRGGPRTIIIRQEKPHDRIYDKKGGEANANEFVS